jgi:NitT/TauT family transport system substrate-binding protein
MSQRTRAGTLVCGLVLAALLAAGCTAPLPVPLTVGANTWPGYEPLYLARDLGYLDPAQVRLVELTSASAVMRALRNGSLDAAALTLDEALLLYQDGLDVRLVLVTDVSQGGHVLLARPEVGTAGQLRGKRVGAETTAAGAHLLACLLHRIGLARGDVEVVPLELPEHESALTKGRVDAVVTCEPVRARLRAWGARALADSRQLPLEIVDVLLVRKDSLNRRPEAVEHLLHGWFRALDELERDPRPSGERMALRSGLSAEEFRTALDGLRFASREENRQRIAVEPAPLAEVARALAAALRAENLLTRQRDLGPLVDPRPLQRLAP